VLVVLDVAWWMICARLVRGSWWRLPVHVFMALQTTVIISVFCGLGSAFRLVPMVIVISAVIWHHFTLGIFLPLGTICAGAWLFWKMTRPKTDPFLQSAPGSLDEKALSRRQFLGVAAAVAPPLLNIGLTGIGVAQLTELRVRRFDLAIPALPKALDGTTIAHITDMHVGGMTDERMLKDMVHKTNALRPDLVLLTGDLIDARLADLGGAMDLVKGMQGRYGQWMIEGNHDLFENEGEFKRRVKAAGIPFLANDSTVTEVRGHPIQLFGLNWFAGGEKLRDKFTEYRLQQLLTHRDPDAFPILLAHHPHAFDAAVRAEMPLTLSGHTHGGQWMFNQQFGVGPVLFRYWSGLYRRDRSQLVVSNGIGNVFPIRVNAPAEIVHLTLHCA